MDDNNINNFRNIIGMIVEVNNINEAKIAEKNGASAIIILNNRKNNNILNISHIKNIKDNINLPIIVQFKIGHLIEAKVLCDLNIDCIFECEESLVKLEENIFIKKKRINKPVITLYNNLGDGLQRISEGAVCLIKHTKINMIKDITNLDDQINDLLLEDIKNINYLKKKYNISNEVMKALSKLERLPSFELADYNITHPIEACLAYELGYDGVIVKNNIFKNINCEKLLCYINNAKENFNNMDYVNKCMII